MVGKATVRAILLAALVVSSAGAWTVVPAAAEIKAPEKFMFCAPCHGPAGEGNGPAAVALDPKPRNFTNGTYMNARTDAQLINVIKNGSASGGFSPLMVGYGNILNDMEIKDIVTYIRSLAVPKYQPKE